MEQSPKPSTRKKFLLWGAAVLSSLTVLKFIPGKTEKKKETVKMLTQDGKLVEVDISKRLYGRREQINDDQLKTWVSKK